MKMRNMIMLAFAIPMVAFGADAVVPELGWIDQIAQFFKDLGTGPTAMIIAAALEFVFRMMKTPKPLSIAHLFAAGMKKAAAALLVVAEFLDRILPQRTSEK